MRTKNVYRRKISTGVHGSAPLCYYIFLLSRLYQVHETCYAIITCVVNNSCVYVYIFVYSNMQQVVVSICSTTNQNLPLYYNRYVEYRATVFVWMSACRYQGSVLSNN